MMMARHHVLQDHDKHRHIAALQGVARDILLSKGMSKEAQDQFIEELDDNWMHNNKRYHLLAAMNPEGRERQLLAWADDHIQEYASGHDDQGAGVPVATHRAGSTNFINKLKGNVLLGNLSDHIVNLIAEYADYTPRTSPPFYAPTLAVAKARYDKTHPAMWLAAYDHQQGLPLHLNTGPSEQGWFATRHTAHVDAGPAAPGLSIRKLTTLENNEFTIADKGFIPDSVSGKCSPLKFSEGSTHLNVWNHTAGALGALNHVTGEFVATQQVGPIDRRTSGHTGPASMVIHDKHTKLTIIADRLPRGYSTITIPRSIKRRALMGLALKLDGDDAADLTFMHYSRKTGLASSITYKIVYDGTPERNLTIITAEALAQAFIDAPVEPILYNPTAKQTTWFASLTKELVPRPGARSAIAISSASK